MSGGDSEHDDDFEAYLKRRVPIQKGATPPDSLEPPPELDRIIIGEARKAIQTPAPIRMYRAPKWALPVGLAATILLSFAVLLNLGIREKHQMLEAAQPQASTATSPTSAARSAEPTSPLPSPFAAKKPAPAAAIGETSVAQVADATQVPPIPTTPWPVANGAPRASASSPAAAPKLAAVDKARTRLARTEAAASRSRRDGETQSAPALFAQAGSPTPKYESIVVTAARRTDNQAPVATPAPVSAQVADELSRSSPISSLDSLIEAPKVDVTAAPATNAPSAATGMAMAAPASAAVPAGQLNEVVATRAKSRAEQPAPAAWLVRIEKLRKDGQIASAEREMQRFRSIYPSYPLPADPPKSDVRAQ